MVKISDIMFKSPTQNKTYIRSKDKSLVLGEMESLVKLKEVSGVTQFIANSSNLINFSLNKKKIMSSQKSNFPQNLMAIKTRY